MLTETKSDEASIRRRVHRRHRRLAAVPSRLVADPRDVRMNRPTITFRANMEWLYAEPETVDGGDLTPGELVEGSPWELVPAGRLTRENLMEVLYDRGWTCEYHEPDWNCLDCQHTWGLTADAVLALLEDT